MELQINDDTIAAVATAPGVGGIAIVRVSGRDAEKIVAKLWRGGKIENFKTHTAHLGKIVGIDGTLVDEVVLTIFRDNHSFTGEPVIELACHGSKWIQREILNQLVKAGVRPAEPGEFTRRAFLNGRIDLAQAEGVADLIASGSRMAHKLAIQQANGQFSARLSELRESLIEFASLLELELDFSEEEVEFADRQKLQFLASDLMKTLRRLEKSYSVGRAFKEGIPVVIAGAPNAGKSTLLNQLLEEDRALVSDIPGTTRDLIEEACEIEGTLFRFVDTAGLRNTLDPVEKMGIELAEDRISKASIVLWIIDADSQDLEINIADIKERMASIDDETKQILVINKIDRVEFSCRAFIRKRIAESRFDSEKLESEDKNADHAPTVADKNLPIVEISAQRGEGIESLKEMMLKAASANYDIESDIMLTNSRHYSSIVKAIESLERAEQGLKDMISADFIAQDVREAIHHLGALTGAITTPDLLASIFANFCIGK